MLGNILSTGEQGSSAWYNTMESYNRHIGMMYYGRYAYIEDLCQQGNADADTFLYIAYNMHWEEHELALPIGWARSRFLLFLRWACNSFLLRCTHCIFSSACSLTTCRCKCCHYDNSNDKYLFLHNVLLVFLFWFHHTPRIHIL